MWRIIGQKKVIGFLQQGLSSGKLPHALLFTGPEHVGKMTAAKDLAKALNCASADRPCQECGPCLKIESGGHADVQVIGIELKDENGEESKVITIEQIKNLQRSASLPPFEGKHKVFIIDGAELLSGDAANRFLKTLEEPESGVTFILVTANDRLLLPTVVSRCQRLDFHPVPRAEIAAALTNRPGMDTERADLLAALSRGRPGWAFTAVVDAGVLERRRELLDRMVGLIGADAAERFSFAAKLAAGFTGDRKAVYDLLDAWRDYWRDILLAGARSAHLITNIDRKDEIIRLAGCFSLADIKEFIRHLESAALQLKQNVNPRLALEVLMLDMPMGEILNAKP